ncbi:hypothetical protein BDR04DRAFT_1164604 [Suillus decipiens]|nr:hypothetical protein BDR04DRAFT_1164604 [Suillus decipiens]
MELLYIFDAESTFILTLIFHACDGKLLMQPCASEKITFPGMWTNTCSPHPLDGFEGEKIEDQLGV